jgi:hypothetical protein
MYRKPIVSSNRSLGDLYYNEMYDIYVAESQKACANTGKMLKQIGFKVTDAYTRTHYDIDTTDGQDPKYHHGCIFKFAAEELNKKKIKYFICESVLCYMRQKMCCFIFVF